MNLEELKKAQQDAQEKITNDISVLKEELQEQLKTQMEGIAIDQNKITSLENQINELQKKESVSKEDFKKLEDALIKQGEAINNNKNTLRNSNSILKEFGEKYKALDENRGGAGSNAPSELFRIKDSTDVIAVDNVTSEVYPQNGTTGVIGTLSGYFAQFVGFFRAKKPVSKIMDLVDIIPMKSDILYSFTESEIGQAEFVPECGLKPIVKPKIEQDEAKAKKVAARFKTTEELRRFYNWVVSRFKNSVTNLVLEKIPNAILNGDTKAGIIGVKKSFTAYTPIPQLATHTSPNNYDALGSVIAFLETLGYVPNAIILNPVAWANMKLLKDTNGQYVLSNGNSISILEDALDWGGQRIEIIKDATIGVDEFLVGDFFNSIKVGIDSDLIYREGYSNDDFERNILTHIVEKFVALLIPKGAKTGIVSDTFSNVKTLITAA